MTYRLPKAELFDAKIVGMIDDLSFGGLRQAWAFTPRPDITEAELRAALHREYASGLIPGNDIVAAYEDDDDYYPPSME